MAAVQDSLESAVVELSENALNAFAGDISTMFEVDIECTQLESGIQPLNKISKNFKKVAAFHKVKAEGVLEGDFTVAFDQGGLFILAGVIVMLPAKRITEDAKRGNTEDAQGMADAVGEVGNLLVGSWDRIFREELDGHKHFTKLDTYIGLPWTSPEETIGLDKSGEFFYALFEMNLEDYPSFKCGVIFPQAMLGSTSSTEASAAVESEPVEVVEAPAEPEPEPEAESVPEDAVQAAEEPQAVEEPSDEAESDAQTAATSDAQAPGEEPAAEEQAEAPDSTEDTSEARADEAAEAALSEKEETRQEEVDEKSVAPRDIPGPVAQQPGPSTAVAPSGLADILSLPAQDIMDTTVVWGTPEESVQAVMAKMQQNDVGYAMIGHEGALEGIVSKSNVLGAISPYLRPVFAQWHTPAADATLDIKVKWIMTRPVRTVGPGATLGVVLQTMQQFGGRCLPVVEPAGKVLGLVTCFDVFRVLTKHEPFGMSGRTPQAPCLMI